MQGFIEHFFGCRECARYLNCVKDNELYDSCTLKHLLVKHWSSNSHLFQIIPGISDKPSKKGRQSKRRYYTVTEGIIIEENIKLPILGGDP